LFALVAVFQTATTAQAGNQLFEGSWTVKSFGNECSLADPTPGPYCGNGADESEFYSAFGIPQGILCNPNQPRCTFESTPTNGFTFREEKEIERLEDHGVDSTRPSATTG
jgi:hypothetical protein